MLARHKLNSTDFVINFLKAHVSVLMIYKPNCRRACYKLHFFKINFFFPI